MAGEPAAHVGLGALGADLEWRVAVHAAGRSDEILAALGFGAAFLVWVALDDDDNDPARLLATLVQSLMTLDLNWEMDPRALVANVAGSGSEARAVLAGIVNALCTSPAERIVWLLDDLHRITDPDCAGLLEALVERLPEHVALVLGSRTEPAMPLARLRAHGELGELDDDHLRFDEASALALAHRRWGTVPTPEVVADTLRRTREWAQGALRFPGAGSTGRTAASPAGFRRGLRGAAGPESDPLRSSVTESGQSQRARRAAATTPVSEFGR